MSFAQLRRELGVRSLPWALLIAAVFGVWLSAVRVGAASELGPIPWTVHSPGPYVVVFFVWTLLWICLWNAGFSRRCGSFELTLPLATRRLWLTHMLACILSGLAPLLAAGGVSALINVFQGRRPVVEPGVISFGVYLGAAMILALAVLQIPKPALWEIPPRKGYVFLIALVLVAGFGLVIALSALPRGYASVPLVVALALGVLIYRSLPATFTAFPLAAEPDEPARHVWPRPGTGVPGSARCRRSQLDRLLHVRILRLLFGNWIWFFLPFLALYGVFHSVGAGVLSPALSTSWIILGVAMFSTGKLYRLDPLPISRRRVFAGLVLPMLLVLMISYGLGSVLVGIAPDYGPRPCRCCVGVPHGFWRIAWNGEVPTTGSPWGETSVAHGAPLFKGSRIILYRPFLAPLERSPQYVALQLSRAVEASYGDKIPAAELARRYLEAAADGTTRLRPSGFTLLADYPQLRAMRGGQRFALTMLLVSLPVLLFAAIFYRLSRAGSSERLRVCLCLVFLIPPVSLALGVLTAKAMGLIDESNLSRISDVLVRQLGEIIPGGTLTIGGLAALLVVGAYLLAQAQFMRLEVPSVPSAKP